MNGKIKNQEDKDQVDWDSNQDDEERNVQNDLIDYETEISYLSRFIQSHGVVLALQEPDLKIIQVSNNTKSILGIKPESLLNQHLKIIVPDYYISIISNRIKDGTENLFYRFKFKEKLRISKYFYNLGQKYRHNFHGLIRRYNNNLILEIEPIKENDQNSELDYYERLKRFINKIKLDYNFEEITQLIVQEIQNVTGYDRVLLYQFERDQSGTVIAEIQKSNIEKESLLGLRFPSFDIPSYARQSFMTNRVRLIVDINAEPSEIIPPFNPVTHEPLDLNLSTLKAVSPCHREYYNNMGVSASLSISLIARENLWGLIVCQNFSPKYINPDTYNYCESLAQYVYLVLHKKQLQQINNYRQETNLIYNQIEQNLKQIIQTPKINTPLKFNLDFLEKEGKFTQNISSNQIKSICNIIEKNGERILQLVQAEGVAIYFGDELICMGNTPTVAQLNNLLHWFTDNYNQEIFSTSHLSEIYPPAQDFTDIASGLLAISIRLHLTSYYVFWFRPEVIQTVQWGGHPSPQYSLNQQGEMKLGPRNSFELWKETVEKKSLPWQDVEIEAARDLKNLLTLTALEFYQTALELAAEKAEIANQSKSQFLAKMSHELRTPLNAILGFSQIMNREDSLTDEQKKYLKIINRSGEHLLSLINDVLEMSRIEAGKITLNENYFDLYQVIESIAEMLQLKASAKNLQLILDCDSYFPKYVVSDENKLRQVLINLLENAIKFTKTGWVKLRVFPGLEATQVFFEVSDTGAGIAPEELGTLFEPFVQSETGRNSMQGTGLGLPISKQFVNLMGGDIKVTSKVNEGSIFTFDIKLRLAEEIDYQGKTPKNREVIALQPDQPHYRILIAEDVEENRLLLIKLLSPIGFDVRTANNGEEAIAIWQEWKPDLILMDMLMPIMDGYEATRKIKAMVEDKNENIKIIAITANALSGANVAPLEAGCDDYMPKPYREEMLFEKIAEQLGVKYCYREDISFSPDSDTENFVLTRESFQVMPQDWIKKLNQGALESDEDVITDLIAQIPETNQNLAETLTQLVENYRFDLLFNLTK